jgi:hypothetical protein
MSWTIATYTVIHVPLDDSIPTPYAVVVLDRGSERAVARAVGELGWLAIGGSASVSKGIATPGAA